MSTTWAEVLTAHDLQAELVEADAHFLGAELRRLACSRCGGSGHEESEGVTRAPTGTPPLTVRACRDCGGDGRQTCDRCGDEPAVAKLGDEALCGDCLSGAADNARHEAGPHASRCAWCRAWVSEADRLRAEAGAMITHGICPACLRDLERGTA